MGRNGGCLRETKIKPCKTAWGKGSLKAVRMGKKTSEGSLSCHTYCDTGPSIIMVFSEDPWHSHLLPSVTVTTCFKDLGLSRTGIESYVLHARRTTQPRLYNNYTWTVYWLKALKRSVSLHVKSYKGPLVRFTYLRVVHQIKLKQLSFSQSVNVELEINHSLI